MYTSRQRVDQAAKALVAAFPSWAPPRALIQMGAGFDPAGLFDETLGDVAMADLGMTAPRPSCTGAPLRLLLGRVGDGTLLVAHGHRYSFEDDGLLESVMPVAAAARAGIRDVVLIEAGAALREDLTCGTWLAATDYINAMGLCPAGGLLELFPDPFLDMTDAFSQTLNADLVNAIAQVGGSTRLGVYQATRGPQFSTPAEAAAARRNGADVLGEAVVPETVVATLLGCRVSALVLIAEPAAAYGLRRTHRRDRMDAAEFCSRTIMRALRLVFSASP